MKRKPKLDPDVFVRAAKAIHSGECLNAGYAILVNDGPHNAHFRFASETLGVVAVFDDECRLDDEWMRVERRVLALLLCAEIVKGGVS